MSSYYTCTTHCSLLSSYIFDIHVLGMMYWMGLLWNWRSSMLRILSYCVYTGLIHEKQLLIPKTWILCVVTNWQQNVFNYLKIIYFCCEWSTWYCCYTCSMDEMLTWCCNGKNVFITCFALVYTKQMISMSVFYFPGVHWSLLQHRKWY